MSQQPYSIQLLNDLHNHFPEILYNPGRFHNIQDLLSYIRNVASASPYDRGLAEYNSRHNYNQPNRQYGTHIPSYRTPVAPRPPTPPEVSRLYNTLPVNSTIPQTYVAATTIIDESDIPPNTRIRMPLNTNTNVLMNTLLGGLFGDILGTSIQVEGGGNLQDFLNQRVVVYPTNEEISNATTTFRATETQEDICAICQDEIENNQEVRRITHCNHYFHQNCIDTWFRGNVHCPTCRHDIREVNQETNPNNRNNQNQNTNPPPVPENYRRMNIRRPDNN